MSKRLMRPSSERLDYKPKGNTKSRNELLNSLTANIMLFLKRRKVPVAFIKKVSVTTCSSEYCSGARHTYRWSAADGVESMSPLATDADAEVILQTAEHIATYLVEAWESVNAKLESFEMVFRRDRYGKIRLTDIEIEMLQIVYQNRQLNFGTNNSYGFQEVFESLQIALQLSEGFSSI